MSIKFISIGFLIALGQVSLVSAQFRKYSNEFLNIGAGAKGLGMGAAQVAGTNDALSGYWNPAGLTDIKKNPQFGLMHAEYFSGIAKYDFACIAFPSKDQKRALAFTYLRFGVDDIPNTLYLVQPDGSINYNNITSFSSADNALLISYAQSIKDFHGYTASIGGSTKIIYRKVGTFAQAWGFGFDLGAKLTKKNLTLGAVLRDATTTFNAWSFNFSDREKEALYLTNNDIPVKSTENTAPRLLVGASYRYTPHKSITITGEADMGITFDGKRNTLIKTGLISIDPSIGIEISYQNSLFVRGGLTNFQQALSDADLTNQKKVWVFQPGLGAGFKFQDIMIDYAYTNLANQSSPLYTHVFSGKLNLVKRYANTAKKY